MNLLETIAAGDLEAVRERLAAGDDINGDVPELVAEEGLETPLTKAAECGHAGVVFLLLEAGADVNRRDGNLRMPLHHAVRRGDRQIARMLLTAGADVDAQTSDDYYGQGPTPLMVAARIGNDDMVRLLLDAGAALDLESDTDTALAWAAINGHPETVALLIAAGAGLSSRTAEQWRDVALQTRAFLTRLEARQADTRALEFLRAATRGDLETARGFLAEGGDVNALWPDGPSAVYLAVYNKHGEMVRLLLDAGADPNRSDGRCPDEFVPLSEAIRRRQPVIARLLIEYGADVNSRDRFGWSVLGSAVSAGERDLVRLLIAHGAAMTRCHSQLNLLELAVRDAGPDMVRLLLDLGADPEGKTRREWINAARRLRLARARRRRDVQKEKDADA